MRYAIVSAVIVIVAVATGVALYVGRGSRSGHAHEAVATDEPRSDARAVRQEPGESFQARFEQALLARVATPPTKEELAEVAPSAADPKANDAVAEPDEESEVSEAAREETRARERRATRAGLEQHFQQQPRGGAWSRDTALTINNSLVSVVKPPGSVLQSVECREALCRIQVATSDEAHYDETFRAILEARWSFGTGPFFLSRDDSDGSTKGLVMFAARNGAALPGVATP